MFLRDSTSSEDSAKCNIVIQSVLINVFVYLFVFTVGCSTNKRITGSTIYFYVNSLWSAIILVATAFFTLVNTLTAFVISRLFLYMPYIPFQKIFSILHCSAKHIFSTSALFRFVGKLESYCE